MTFLLRLLFPQNYKTITASMFRNNVFITCCKLSKSLLNPEKVQGSTMQTPIKIRWLPITSIDAPQISARIHPLLTQLPRDAPHRSIHQTFIPLSPIWLRLRRRTSMDWLMGKAPAKAWKRWKAERQADDSWQNRNQRLLFQMAFHLHWKWKKILKSRNDFFLGPMEFKLEKNTNPKLEVTCDASISQKKDIMCTNMCRLQGCRYRCIHVSPTFHAKASTYPALPCVKHCGIVAQHKIIESLPKQRTKYSNSQGTLSKTILFSLHVLFPQNYHRFHTCCKLSKSLLNPEKVQGSTINPLIKSCDFPSLPLMLHRSQPGSIHFWHNLPETLRIAPPTRPSCHCHQSGCGWGEGVW